MPGHSSYINCLAFEEIFLVSGSNDKCIKKWNITDFQCEVTFTGHRSVINKLVKVFSLALTNKKQRSLCNEILNIMISAI